MEKEAEKAISEFISKMGFVHWSFDIPMIPINYYLELMKRHGWKVASKKFKDNGSFVIEFRKNGDHYSDTAYCPTIRGDFTTGDFDIGQ